MTPDAVVVGSGPNGLAAAVTLARAGLSVLVLEEQDTAGGGSRTVDLGLADGIRHDLCSAVHPMAWASPFFRALGLSERVQLCTPEASFAHPLDGGRAAIAWHDLARTVADLGPDDGRWWQRTLGPLAELGARGAGLLLDSPTAALPPDRQTVAALATIARSTARLALRPTRLPRAAALVAGVAAHAMGPLRSPTATGTAVMLGGLAHSGAGWPVPRGGSQALVDALIADLLAHGGQVVTGHPVRGHQDLPPARATLFAAGPPELAHALRATLPPRTRSTLGRHRFGPGAAAKVDLVVRGDVPWSDPRIGRAVTAHLGGGHGQIDAAERTVAAGRHAEQPYVLFGDPAVADPSRAQGELRPLWAYAHVPYGSTVDPLPAVLAQIERFAPGFRDTVVAAQSIPAAEMSAHDSALHGGDISGGTLTLRRLLAGPLWQHAPYRVGVAGAYLCSSAEPPGPGVHGMAGYRAARLALREVWGLADPLAA